MHNINISIDDVSPHPLSSTKVIKQCNKIIEKYPEVKFTLFVPVAYWRTMRANVATPQPLELSKFPSFCEELRNLPENNFEVGYHGYHHGIPNVTNNDEFHYIDYNNADYLFKLMRRIAREAGLQDKFKPIFRPPAWKMSKDAIKASKANNIKLLALSPNYEYEEEFEHIVYATCGPPLFPLELTEKTEIVYHACEWDRNYLDKNKAENLKDFLLGEKDNIDFCFMEDM